MNENFDGKQMAENEEVQSRLREIDEAIAKYNELMKQSEAREKSVDAKEKEIEAAASSALKKKMIAMVLITLCALVTFISSTLAYFTASTGSSGNVIATGGAGFEFVDLVYPPGSTEGIPVEEVVGTFFALPGDDFKRSVSAVNRGGTSVYVRAKVKCDITLKEKYAEFSDSIDESVVLYDVGDSWLTRDTFDGYYYYETTLARGVTTPDFISNISFSDDMGNMYKGATVSVKVVFEIVQAEGNGETVFDAVGWPASEEGGNA